MNGPEVIEQEAGVREFDSSDKDLIWNTLGSRQRVESKIIDELVTDSVEAIKAAVIAKQWTNEKTRIAVKAQHFIYHYLILWIFQNQCPLTITMKQLLTIKQNQWTYQK